VSGGVWTTCREFAKMAAYGATLATVRIRRFASVCGRAVVTVIAWALGYVGGITLTIVGTVDWVDALGL
jgi:hypothetical protein